MFRKEGAEAIGSEEYEVQVRKRGSGKHLNALARKIARVIMMMGLESGSGAFAMPISNVLQSPMFHGMSLDFHGCSSCFALFSLLAGCFHVQGVPHGARCIPQL